MEHTIRMGYRRASDGSAEPICEPPVDAFLLSLWGHAGQAILETDAFVAIGALDGMVRVEGRIRPATMANEIKHMVSLCAFYMNALANAIDEGYPFEEVADAVIRSVGRTVIFRYIDRPFVETEPPGHCDDDSIVVKEPRIEYPDGRLRVVVTGNPMDHPMRHWADAIIRNRVRDTILEKLAGKTTADA